VFEHSKINQTQFIMSKKNDTFGHRPYLLRKIPKTPTIMRVRISLELLLPVLSTKTHSEISSNKQQFSQPGMLIMTAEFFFHI